MQLWRTAVEIKRDFYNEEGDRIEERRRNIENFFYDIIEANDEWDGIEGDTMQELLEKHGITELKYPEKGSAEEEEWGPDEKLQYLKEEYKRP